MADEFRSSEADFFRENRMLTYSAVDGTQRHETLHVVGQGATVGVPVGVLSSLQDELLTLEVVVLKAHPAVEGRRAGVLASRGLFVAAVWGGPGSQTYAPLSTLMERMLSRPHS